MGASEEVLSACSTAPASSGEPTPVASASTTPTDECAGSAFPEPKAAAHPEERGDDGLAVSCLLSLMEAAQGHATGISAQARGGERSASALRPPALDPAHARRDVDGQHSSPLCTGSLFDSLYHGLKADGDGSGDEDAEVLPTPGRGMAAEGLVEMWQESLENEKLILELAAGAMGNDTGRIGN